MTRIKEPPPGSNKVELNYKSPPARIIRSLRKGYDNVRKKIEDKSDQLQVLRGKLRDTQVSRDDWKARAKKAETISQELEKKTKQLEDQLKKSL